MPNVAVTAGFEVGNPFLPRRLCLTLPKRASSLPVDDLVVRLGQMPVELAAPLLRSNLSGLTEPVLLSLIKLTGPAHHELIAQRRDLGWRVVKALIGTEDAGTLCALLRNGGVILDDDDREALVDAGSRDPAIGLALSERPDMATRLRPRATVTEQQGSDNLRVLKALRAGDFERFLKLSAPRLNIGIEALRAALRDDSPLPHILLFRGLGLDKAVFLNVMADWRRLSGGLFDMDSARRPMLLVLFDLAPESAAARLRALCAR